MSKVGGGDLNIPDDLDGEGFSIFCSACKEQYTTIIFDASTDDSTYSHENPNHEAPITYTIGIRSATSFKDLERALFEGIKNAPGKPTNASSWQGNPAWGNNCQPDTDSSVIVDIQHNLRIAKNPRGEGYVFLKGSAAFPPDMGFYDLGKVVNVVGVETDDVYGLVDVTEDVLVYPLVRDEGWIMDPGNPLVIHHGPKANQSLHCFINDMHCDSLRSEIPNEADIQDMKKNPSLKEIIGEASSISLSEAKVTTRHNASVAIRVVDGAIDYALNEATYVGAYISRLDFTEANIVAAGENTTAAESVIRDADMALEAMNYVKNNILMHSSQSMLAQANQSASSVLSLLQ